MGKSYFENSDAMFTEEQRERIRNTLYEMFLKNEVAIVDVFEEEMKAFRIRNYVLRKAGIG